MLHRKCIVKCLVLLFYFELIGFQETEEPINTEISKNIQKMERKEFIKAKFGEKGNLIVDTDMAKVGLSNPEPEKLNYDYIERDYK